MFYLKKKQIKGKLNVLKFKNKFQTQFIHPCLLLEY